ncbi:MAG: iron-sulfur cluster assembly scaffold protein [Candidatus Altiarchaeota archaeon]
MYSKDVMDHFQNPRNVGEIADADGVGEAGNMRCGDLMWVYLRVGRNPEGKDYVEDIKFKTLGCAAAIATSSKATELAKGRTIDEALAVTNQDIASSLGGLPPVKLHCSMLAADALKEAVYDYYSKKGIKMPPELEAAHLRIRRERTEIEHTQGAC